MRRLLILLTLAGCTGPMGTDGANPGELGGKGDAPGGGRAIADTHLDVNLQTLAASATISFEAGADSSARLELSRALAGRVSSVTGQARVDGDSLVLSGLPEGGARVAVDYTLHIGDGYNVVNVEDEAGAHLFNAGTFMWPSNCGALFPCHSDPADGTSFSLALTGVPDGMTAVYPPTLPEAPSYQIAWAVGRYRYMSFGTTSAGTEVGFYVLSADVTPDYLGGNGELLRKAFDFLERTYGAYRFGRRVASVEVAALPDYAGGQEHHPFWHVGTVFDDRVNVHEATHGWFGDGVRMGCWEDLIVSEGVTTYVTARTMISIGAQTEERAFADLSTLSSGLRDSGVPAWPQGCSGDTSGSFAADGKPHIEAYARGAQFLREVARQVGVEVLDGALADFYRDHGGKSAHVSDLLDSIRTSTRFDPTALADTWLRAGTTPKAAP